MKTTKEKIIEILDQYHIKPIGWIEGGVREKLSNQILELFKQENNDWLLKKFNLTIKDLPAFPPKDINLKELIFAIGMGKRLMKWETRKRIGKEIKFL